MGGCREVTEGFLEEVARKPKGKEDSDQQRQKGEDGSGKAKHVELGGGEISGTFIILKHALRTYCVLCPVQDAGDTVNKPD